MNLMRRDCFRKNEMGREVIFFSFVEWRRKQELSLTSLHISKQAIDDLEREFSVANEKMRGREEDLDEQRKL